MKTTKVTTRLNANEYSAVKRQAKLQKKSINTLMVELMLGKLCLCPHHASLIDTNPNNLSSEMLTQALETQELAFEILILLRDFTALTDPKLVHSAYKQRAEYYDNQQNEDEN